jgi:hypothetical protein
MARTFITTGAKRNAYRVLVGKQKRKETTSKTKA